MYQSCLAHIVILMTTQLAEESGIQGYFLSLRYVQYDIPLSSVICNRLSQDRIVADNSIIRYVIYQQVKVV